jgi:hypothetical protein
MEDVVFAAGLVHRDHHRGCIGQHDDTEDTQPPLQTRGAGASATTVTINHFHGRQLPEWVKQCKKLSETRRGLGCAIE